MKVFLFWITILSSCFSLNAQSVEVDADCFGIPFSFTLDNTRSPDGSGRNIYEVNGILIAFSTANNRWEIIADGGNFDVYFYNTFTSSPNPPDNLTSAWTPNGTSANCISAPTVSGSGTQSTLGNDPCENLGGDSDGDGVCDDSDVCPGFDDNMDQDGDMIPDDCDPNPTIPDGILIDAPCLDPTQPILLLANGDDGNGHNIYSNITYQLDVRFSASNNRWEIISNDLVQVFFFNTTITLPDPPNSMTGAWQAGTVTACVNNAQISVTGTGTASCDNAVLTTPTSNSSIGNNTFCYGDPIEITVNGTPNDATHWNLYKGACGTDYLIESIPAVDGAKFMLTASETSTYFIGGTGPCILSPPNCSGILITVNGLQADAGSDQKLLGSTSATMQANGGFGDGTWTFVNPGDGQASFSDINNPNASLMGSAGQTYTLRWTINNAALGCPDTYDDVIITFLDQTGLTLGDLGFVSYSAEDNNFSFVILKDINAGTSIKFTDRGSTALGGFRGGEGTITVEFCRPYLCGTEFNLFSEAGEIKDVLGQIAGTVTGLPLDLSPTGDQLFAYQGPESNLITGIQMNGAWNTDATDDHTSAKPTAFIDGENAISIFPEAANAWLDCNSLSMASSIGINTLANWNTADNLNNFPGLPLNCFQSCCIPAAASSISGGSGGPFCPGTNLTLQVSGQLNDDQDWVWYSGSCGGIQLGSGSTISITPLQTTTYFVRGEGACLGYNGNCVSFKVEIKQVAYPVISNIEVDPPNCPGGNDTITVIGALNDADQWVLYSDDCGENQLSTSMDGIFYIPNQTTRTFYVGAEGECITSKQRLIWEDQFNNEIPSTWTMESTPAGADWAWASDAQADDVMVNGMLYTATFYGVRSNIQSPSYSNGCAMFNGDAFDSNGNIANLGTGPFPGPHNSVMSSHSIDCSLLDQVFLRFNQYYREFDAKTFVGVSTDNGLSWAEFEVNSTIAFNSETAPDDIQVLDISAMAANEPNVKIRFTWKDGSYYFWLVDDVQIFGSSCYAVDVQLKEDQENPSFSNCPSDFAVNSDPGRCGAIVTWSPPNLIDNCAIGTFSSTHNPGDFFPVGNTLVTYTGQDAAGNMAMECSFNITVNDNETPIFSGCPANILVNNDPGDCGAIVQWTPPEITDNCPGVMFVSTHNPGDFFPVGSTKVIYSGQDASGLFIECSFTVTVSDNEIPFISCPDTVTLFVETDCQADLIDVLGDVMASDNCTQVDHILFLQEPMPGTKLEAGITPIVVTAMDSDGNESTCTVQISVIAGTGTISSLNCSSDFTVLADCHSGNAQITLPVPSTPRMCVPTELQYRYRPVNNNNTALGDYSDKMASSENIIVLAIGRYEIEWELSDQFGVHRCSQYIQVNPIILTTPEITGTIDVCPGLQNIEYSIVAQPGVSQYNWSFSGSGVSIHNNGSPEITLDFSSNATSGLLSVMVIDPCGGANTSNSVQIEIGNLANCFYANCLIANLFIRNSTLLYPGAPRIFKVSEEITSDLNLDMPGSLLFQAGQSINLEPGFSIQSGATFIANIGSCLISNDDE